VKHETTRVCHFRGDVIVYKKAKYVSVIGAEAENLVRSSGVVEIKNLYVALSRSSNEHRVLYVKGITSFW